MAERPEIVMCAALAHRPGRGGHAWALLQWPLALVRLGWSVLWVDRLERSMVAPGCTRSVDDGLSWVGDTLGRLAPEVDIAVLADGGEVVAGIDRDELLARARSSVALIDVMGFCIDDELLASVPRRIGLDIDPGFGQLWADAALFDPFAHHDDVVTVGLNIGTDRTSIPDGGRTWTPTLPPVVLEHWPDLGPGTGPVTSVGAWRGPSGPLERDGTRLGLRVHAARPLAGLPGRTGTLLRMAWEFDEVDVDDRAAFVDAGWDLVDPAVVAASMESYRDFVAGSSAELCVAKELYSAARTGWFSDRSAVYLASGRPVVASDTGLPPCLLPEQGFLTFDDLDSAAVALDEVARHPVEHSAAARNFAEQHLDSDLVLTDLLTALELT
jgi:hypothetical protein